MVLDVGGQGGRPQRRRRRQELQLGQQSGGRVPEQPGQFLPCQGGSVRAAARCRAGSGRCGGYSLAIRRSLEIPTWARPSRRASKARASCMGWKFPPDTIRPEARSIKGLSPWPFSSTSRASSRAVSCQRNAPWVCGAARKDKASCTETSGRPLQPPAAHQPADVAGRHRLAVHRLGRLHGRGERAEVPAAVVPCSGLQRERQRGVGQFRQARCRRSTSAPTPIE